MAETYAKLVTAKGEHEMSHRELDELRMLLAVSLRNDNLPNAEPPVMESDYEKLKEFIEDNFEKEHYPNETEYL